MIGGQTLKDSDRFVVDVVIMYVNHLVDRLFALECNKSEPCNSFTTRCMQVILHGAQTTRKKHSESANFHQTAILDFVESYI